MVRISWWRERFARCRLRRPAASEVVSPLRTRPALGGTTTSWTGAVAPATPHHSPLTRGAAMPLYGPRRSSAASRRAARSPGIRRRGRPRRRSCRRGGPSGRSAAREPVGEAADALRRGAPRRARNCVAEATHPRRRPRERRALHALAEPARRRVRGPVRDCRDVVLGGHSASPPEFGLIHRAALVGAVFGWPRCWRESRWPAMRGSAHSCASSPPVLGGWGPAAHPQLWCAGAPASSCAAGGRWYDRTAFAGARRLTHERAHASGVGPRVVTRQNARADDRCRERVPGRPGKDRMVAPKATGCPLLWHGLMVGQTEAGDHSPRGAFTRRRGPTRDRPPIAARVPRTGRPRSRMATPFPVAPGRDTDAAQPVGHGRPRAG
jgi:hypothetical protein